MIQFYPPLHFQRLRQSETRRPTLAKRKFSLTVKSRERLSSQI